MGLQIARLLSQRGANVIIVARDAKKLQAALETVRECAKNPSTQRFTTISADVSSESENERLLAEATAWNHNRVPDVVWTNAGTSQPQLFLESSVGTLRRQMEINYWSHVYLAHKTLRAWLYPDTPYNIEASPKSGKPKSELPRHFIMTSSSVAFVNVGGYATYGPAKSALRALADSLRSEILMYNGARRSKNNTKQAPAPFDVNIQIVFPGTVTSPGLENENKTKHPITHALESGDPVQSELVAATAAIKGLEAGKYSVPTNWLGKLMRLSSMGGIPRDNLFVDTFGQWLTSILWLFIWPDLDSKVWEWGKKEGMQPLKTPA